ncbi:MAG: hypothetical protein SNJ54_16790 [Anaerolineae bacterium]
MTLYVCWRALDRTSDVVEALTQAYLALPMRGAMASPTDDSVIALKVAERVAASTALVWVLGPYTLDLVNEEGRRLLAQRDDLQRLELETALRHEVPVIVVCCNAQPPTADDLPRDLKPLAAAPHVIWESPEATLPPLISMIETVRRPPRPDPLPTRSYRTPRPWDRLRWAWQRWVKGIRACLPLLALLIAAAVFVLTLLQLLD